MTDTPPDWVLIEAAKRCEWIEEQEVERIRLYDYEHNEAFRALCDMILKHEQPPVDRKLLCAQEAVTSANMNELDWGEITASAACLRAIELWEEGFGK